VISDRFLNVGLLQVVCGDVGSLDTVAEQDVVHPVVQDLIEVGHSETSAFVGVLRLEDFNLDAVLIVFLCDRFSFSLLLELGDVTMNRRDRAVCRSAGDRRDARCGRPVLRGKRDIVVRNRVLVLAATLRGRRAGGM
jgi:hypothetical protein